MPTYRITEKKVCEHLGKEFEEIVNPFKSPRFVISLVVLLSFAFLLAFVTYDAWAWPFFGWFFFFSSILCAVASVGAHFWFRQINLDNILPRMRDLVNDHALLWLNTKSPHEKTARWERTKKGELSSSTFQLLAYLNAEGTAQGIHTKIKSMKNANSAYVTLKRLAEKTVFGEPIIVRKGNDFRYIPWQFKVVDEHNEQVATAQAQKIEKLLTKAWDKLLEKYFKWEGSWQLR